MKNELMLVFTNGGWLYYKTNATTASAAKREFLKTLEKVGITPDNMLVFIVKAILRDADGNDIDEICEL